MKHTLQVTCLCSAYPFPHRVSSGACSGSSWATSYRELDGACCEFCDSLNTGFSGCRGDRAGTCDVSGGLESIVHCEGYQEYLDTQTSQRLPQSLNAFMANQYNDYYEGAML